MKQGQHRFLLLAGSVLVCALLAIPSAAAAGHRGYARLSRPWLSAVAVNLARNDQRSRPMHQRRLVKLGLCRPKSP